MPLSVKMLRKQMSFFKSFVDDCGIQTCRLAQNQLGSMMSAQHKFDVTYTDISLMNFSAAWINPKEQQSNGVILYLHGGGYVAGDLEYSKGFGTLLAVKNHIKVFCAAYRLAPEFPFPAALEDAVTAYRFLLKSGYDGSQILLCGESAGGGLIYSLTLKLQALHLPQPCGLLAFSPWTDLTMSGMSFESNMDIDPSMSKKRLEYYAACYTNDPENSYVSPLFAEFNNFPPSLIFVGGDEVLLDDSVKLHEKLTSSGNKSELISAPGMWHVYNLFGLPEREDDNNIIKEFIHSNITELTFQPQWMPLDNAGKIYPAAMSRKWSNVFRLSVTLSVEIDPVVLQSALEITVRRFPSMAVRLRRGMFWYYLEQVQHAPSVKEDGSYPCRRMKLSDIRSCALRVSYYNNRIAVEFFHALTDGNGGLVFLKTLTAEYLEQKYGAEIKPEHGVLDRTEKPTKEELEDSFIAHSGEISASRKEATSYRLNGTKEPDGFVNLTCGIMNVDDVMSVAKKYDATLTEFLAAVMAESIIELQNKEVTKRRKQKPVKVLIPVNLRKFFNSCTLRNFVLYTTPSIDTRMGDYTFDEILKQIHHQMKLDLTAKQMNSKITTNVKSEQALILRVMPLFIKNFAMRIVYTMVGEKKSCLSMSNLGAATLPENMMKYVDRIDFILGPQATTPSNCGIISFKNILYINFTRNIIEPSLESLFFKKIIKFGIHVKIESNQR